MKYIYDILLIALETFLLTGCQITKYVPMPQVQIDSIYINRVQHDSIYQKDSIYIHEKGDTTFFHTYKYIFIDKVIRDTLFVEKTDSVSVLYPVEKELTRWQRIKLEAGGIAIGIIFFMVIFLLIKRRDTLP